MSSPKNLPVPVEGPVLIIRNPEEYAAMLKASWWLARVVADHKEILHDHTEEEPTTGEEDRPFLYGQCWYVRHEVWDPEWDFEDYVGDDPFDPEDLDPFL